MSTSRPDSPLPPRPVSAAGLPPRPAPFAVAPLHRMTRRLAAVAGGRVAPDLVLTGARVLSVTTEQTAEGREVWVAGGRVAAVREAGAYRRTRRGGARVVDVAGGILAPGLVDPHVHVESSMMTVCAYAEAALRAGVTTIFCDSHEIANVCGEEGVEWMLRDARRAPLNVFLTVPSTVPATNPRLETAGGDLDAAAIGRIFDRWPEAVALGEKMDFVPVVLGDRRSHAIVAEALRRGRPVCGHVYGREFVGAYAASGVTDTHEAISGEIAHDLLEAGLWVFLRGGPPTTPWHSLPEAIQAVTELGAATKRVCVCTDDRDADDLLLFGLDWVVRQAAEAGLRAEVAWSLGSLHPAERYGLDGELGCLGGGRRADLVLLDDELRPHGTWYAGVEVVREGRVRPELERVLARPYRYPRRARATVRIPVASARPSALVPPPPRRPAVANVIRAVLPGIVLEHARVELEAAGDWAPLLAAHRLCHVAVVERHGRRPGVAHGLLQDFGLRAGAVASTVGHDAHNLVVAGLAAADMAQAVEVLREARGGVGVVVGGRVRALVPLPLAGLLSDRRAGEVARATRALKEAWAAAGCALPYMGFNLIPLSVIPAIRLTDRGLVLVPSMRQVPLLEAR